jgi:GT2 family glycosyltransferase
VPNSHKTYTVDPPSVTVLVLHWRGIDKTRRCLASLRTSTYANYKVLLVDNGSAGDGLDQSNSDGVVLASEFPEVDLLSLDRNYGFAGGCNHGLKRAMANGAAFIWLLNNDAVARPESIDHLIKAALANPSAAAFGAVVLEGNSERAEEAGIGEISFARAKTYLRKMDGKKKQESGGDLTTYSCDWLSGSNLLLRHSALEKVGIFDERYYLYFEDVELCHRFKLAGFECLLVPGSTIEHEGNASTQGSLSLWRNYYHSRNRLMFFLQYAPAHLKCVALASIMGHLAKHMVTLPARGKKGKARLKAEWLGFKDYFNGKSGRAECLDWCESVEF